MLTVSGATSPHRVKSVTPVVQRSSDLDAQLASCKSQLADWVTCPSASTPAGKAKIEQITSRFNAVKAQIKKADVAPSERPEPATRLDSASTSTDLLAYSVDGQSVTAVLGIGLDTYA